MKVLKFGGSSVKGAEEMRRVAEIILQSQEQSKKIAVVVSSLGGVTDSLISIGETAALRDHSYEKRASLA